MSIFRKLFGRKSELSTIEEGQPDWIGAVEHDDTGFRFCLYKIPGILSVNIQTDDAGWTYEIYDTTTRIIGLRFLRKIPIHTIPDLFYVVVTTPQGTICKDQSGMFDESTGITIY